MFEEACARLPREELFRITGLAVQPFNTLFQLLATRLQNPAMLDRAASLLFMPDLMAYFLTGVTATEYSIASTSQLLDVRERTWSSALLRAMDLPSRLFPQIQASGAIRGPLLSSVREELSAPQVPVIAVTTHDTASAVVSVPLQTSREAYLSSGTWSLLGVETVQPVLDRAVMEANVTNEGGFGGTFRVLRNVMGLWLLQECKREWDQEGGETTYEELIAGAEKSKPLQCLVDPDSSTFYSPGRMQQKIRQVAAAAGQVAPATRGEFTRAILESLAMKYRWVVERLEELLGYRLEALVIVGGGVRNTLLNQLTANVLGRPVRCGPSEATAVGNTLVQLHALGEVGGLPEMRDVVRASFPSPLYLPQNAEAWETAYHERFLPLVSIVPQTS
jgi:sugar (pentulose or hexulose) kinase